MEDSSGAMMAQLIIQLVIMAVLLIPASNILKRAGYSPWFALLGIVPIVNIVMFLVFAFSNWPRLRAQNAAVTETFE